MSQSCSLLLALTLLCGVIQAENPKSTAIYMLRQGEEQAIEIATVPGFPQIHSPEISPDKEWVAVDSRSNVLLLKVADGTVKDLGGGMMPSWSPDSQWIAYCKTGINRGVYVRTLEGDHEQLISQLGWGIQWAPDGLQAAYSEGNKIVIYDFINDTRRKHLLSDYILIYWNFAWSPDSKKICFRGMKRDPSQIDIAVVDVSTEKTKVRVLCDGTHFNPDIAWHPKDDIIAFPAARNEFDDPFAQIYTISLAEGSKVQRLPNQPENRHNGGMSWSRDGELLVFVSRL